MNPPVHLSDHCRDLWTQLTTAFVLEPTELELIRLGLEAIDRCEQARATLARDGIVTNNRYGAIVAHPCVAIERDSRIAGRQRACRCTSPNAQDEPAAIAPRRARSWRARAPRGVRAYVPASTEGDGAGLDSLGCFMSGPSATSGHI